MARKKSTLNSYDKNLFIADLWPTVRVRGTRPRVLPRVSSLPLRSTLPLQEVQGEAGVRE
jgi:hypothetical protein